MSYQKNKDLVTPIASKFAFAAMIGACLTVTAQAQSTGGTTDSSSSSAAAAPTTTMDPQITPIAPTATTRRGYGIDYRYDRPTSGNYLQVHGFDLAGSGTGRYQTSITHQSPNLAGTTEGVGFLANIREHPTSWFGLELNYGYNKYSEHYRVTPAGGPVSRVQLEQHEATAGYVFHIRTPYVQPFIVLGGGGVNFRATPVNPQFSNQWRGAAMYEVGLDFVSKRQPHLGFRIQEHGLFYKAPDFYVASFRSNSWVHQALPAAGVFYRF